MSRAAIAAIVALGASCSPKSEPPPQPVQAPADAATTDGITAIGTFDPASGRHLDDDGAGVTRPVRPKNRPTRPLDIMLRSTPTGAMAAVDGVQVGITPAYWFGESDGREHEFTFVLRNHAVARYRFVPIQSGVVHARLEPVAVDEIHDGGVPPEMAPPPTFTPDAAPVMPPPTVITPVDAQLAPNPSDFGPQP